VIEKIFTHLDANAAEFGSHTATAVSGAAPAAWTIRLTEFPNDGLQGCNASAAATVAAGRVGGGA
jgi:hypothetical protein